MSPYAYMIRPFATWSSNLLGLSCDVDAPVEDPSEVEFSLSVVGTGFEAHEGATVLASAAREYAPWPAVEPARATVSDGAFRIDLPVTIDDTRRPRVGLYVDVDGSGDCDLAHDVGWNDVVTGDAIGYDLQTFEALVTVSPDGLEAVEPGDGYTERVCDPWTVDAERATAAP